MTVLTAIAFITIITVLVAAHELGHYLFARLFKMGVEEFAIGFGKKPIWTYARKRYQTPEGEEVTNFTIRPWPLGGFVRIKGMMPEDGGGETKLAGGFYSKPAWQRIIVLLAGPVFSVVAGLAILIPLYMIQGVPTVSNKPVIGEVLEGAAKQAGLAKGDTILSVDGKPVSTFFEVISIVRDKPELPVQIAFRREGDVKVATVTPTKDPEPTPVLNEKLEPTPVLKVQGKMGARWEYTHTPLSFNAALTKSLQAPVEMVKSLVGIATLKRKASDELGGPLTMINATQRTVESGIGDVIALGGLLSISLGIFNMLPIPPLDGGQIIVAFAEMLRGGRRLSMKVQEGIGTVGFSLLLLMIVSILVIDIKRFNPFKGDAAAPPVKSK